MQARLTQSPPKTLGTTGIRRLAPASMLWSAAKFWKAQGMTFQWPNLMSWGATFE